MTCFLDNKAYLEVVIFVDVPSREPGDLSHRGQVHVGVREEEEVHAAPGCHTLLAQLGVEITLRCQYGLKTESKRRQCNCARSM